MTSFFAGVRTRPVRKEEGGIAWQKMGFFLGDAAE